MKIKRMITAVIILTLIQATMAAAQEKGIQSQGNLIFEEGKTAILEEDFRYLQQEILRLKME